MPEHKPSNLTPEQIRIVRNHENGWSGLWGAIIKELKDGLLKQAVAKELKLSGNQLDGVVAFILQQYKKQVKDKTLFRDYLPAKHKDVYTFLCNAKMLADNYALYLKEPAAKTEQVNDHENKSITLAEPPELIIDGSKFLSDLMNRIGEHGAEEYAKNKGWTQLLGAEDKSSRQGFDQVWKDSSDVIHVIEAKGGNGTCVKSYGYKQGTVKWAVAVANVLLDTHETDSKSPSNAKEKEIAQIVLTALTQNRLEIHVIRTKVENGKFRITVISTQ